MSYSASAGAIPLRAVQGSNSWYIGARDANLVFSYDGNNDAAYRGIAYNKNYYYLADVLSDGSRTFFFVNNLITTLDSTKAGAPGLVGLGTGGYAPKECAIIGDIAEVLAFSRRLTNAERLVVESYLRARWPKGTAIEDMADAAPITQADMCAAPNPFNPSISVRYALPVQTKASLTVYSISGAKVRTLTDAVHRAGRYQVQWDGRDNNRAQVAAGVYLLRLEGNNIRLQKKITYLK
jgi:hypothetical protein